MRDRICTELNKYLKCGKAFDYLLDAVELYNTNGDTLKRVYAEVAARRNVKASAVERCISLAVSDTAVDRKITAKAFIAGIKERIMFDIDE